jgi:hypothetical protein
MATPKKAIAFEIDAIDDEEYKPKRPPPRYIDQSFSKRLIDAINFFFNLINQAFIRCLKVN